MKYNIYTILGLLFSCGITIFFASTGLDYVYFEMKVYHFFGDKPIIAMILGILLVISYLGAPILLLIGYYKALESRICLKNMLPFIINIALFLFGCSFLFMALGEIILRPLLIAAANSLFYILAIALLRMKMKKRLEK